MSHSRPRPVTPRRGPLAAALALLVVVVLSATAAQAHVPTPGRPVAVAPMPVAPGVLVPTLTWAPCGVTQEGTAAGVECATAGLPMDYDDPGGAQVQIAVARVPAVDRANRIGSLFFNFGGPGASSVDFLQTAGAGFLATLNQRFDLVAFDPRGVGQSTPAIDCRVDQEAVGLASQPFPTPLDVDVPAFVAKSQTYVDACLANGEILAHVSTANVARDLDVLRAAVGDQRLNYLGFSYGTVLGSTYASLFPDNYRALVLDGAVDPQEYVHDPSGLGLEQTAGFERAFSRFLEACAVDQVACSGFGGADPRLAYDQLVAAADANPIPAPGYAPDPRPVDGDDIRAVTLIAMYAKQFWGDLAAFLAQTAAGDGSAMRAAVDEAFYGRRPDGTFDPGGDRFFTIAGSEQRYRPEVEFHLDVGANSWASFPHFWWNTGYPDVSFGLWPVDDADAFGGPWTVPASSPTPLVIGTAYDPATPYAWSEQLSAQLGNARLLTMEGDGHTAYGGNSPCVDAATEAYLVDLALPAPGTVCAQEVPFTAPVPVEASTATSVLASAGRLTLPVGSR
ncbi:alpha/beta hydrolase [Geodermatophilus sp. SYSU D00815]